MRAVLAVVLALALPLSALAQEASAPADTTANLGLSFGVPSPQSSTVGLIWFVDSAAALHLELGLAMQLAPATEVGFSLGLAFRSYQARTGDLAFFLQPGLTFGRLAQDFFLTAAGLVGAEYFFTEQFTLSGLLGVALVFGDDFNTIAFQTTTPGLALSFYF